MGFIVLGLNMFSVLISIASRLQERRIDWRLSNVTETALNAPSMFYSINQFTDVYSYMLAFVYVCVSWLFLLARCSLWQVYTCDRLDRVSERFRPVVG
jgi:hypothetical protein